MTKKIKNSYWSCLLVLLLAIQVIFFAVGVSVRDAQARYPQTTRINTVVQGPTYVVKSNCLTSNGSQIVLIGNKTKAEFTLVCEKDTEIRINWIVVSDNALVKCRTTERELPNGTEILLKANEVTTVTMEISQNTEKNIDVIVTCGELGCVFRANLIDEEEISEQQPYDDTEVPETEDVDADASKEGDSCRIESETEIITQSESEEIASQVEESQDSTVFIKTIAEIDRTGYIPVVIKSDESDEIIVSINGGDFPKFTRYSTDGGNTWYLMYGAGKISLNASQKTIVLLDIPLNAISEATEITITAMQNGTKSSATAKFTDIILPESTLIITKEFTHLKTGKEPDKIIYVSGIAAEVPLHWDNPECTIEILTEDEEGKKTYIPMIIDEESTLQIKVENVEMKDESVKQIVALVMGEEYVPAGTYRLKCNWEYEGVCFKQAEIPFFINYSTCSDV